jgi:hypothetical protein
MTTDQQEDGRDYDRDEILKDGERYRRPMTLMDSKQQEDAAAITRAALASAYPSASGALHRPGTIVSDGIEGQLAAAERAARRDLRLDQLSERWRDPPTQEHQAGVQQDQASDDAELRLHARKKKLEAAWQMGMGSGPDRRSA